jgi:hypothetical protein
MLVDPNEVVAIAGTAETLLGEIQAGDTVELNPNVEPNEHRINRMRFDGVKSLNTVKETRTILNELHISCGLCVYWHPAKYFRKVSTPLSNPLNTVEGC